MIGRACGSRACAAAAFGFWIVLGIVLLTSAVEDVTEPSRCERETDPLPPPVETLVGVFSGDDA